MTLYFKSLLGPDDSAVVIVDGAAPGLSAGSDEDTEAAPLDVPGFVAAMLSLDVPVIETAMDGAATLTRSAVERRAGPIVRDVANPWSDPAFRAAIDAAGRPRLVVLGACAETTLTQTALSALENGFDVRHSAPPPWAAESLSFLLEQGIKDIRRATRRQYSAEEKIRIVPEGLRGEDSIAALCRCEGITESLHYNWSKEFVEAG